MFHLANAHLLDPRFTSPIDVDERFVDARRCIPQGAGLTSHEHNASLVPVAQFVVEFGASVGGENFLTGALGSLFSTLGHFAFLERGARLE
jgi:hypothetical protein